jgi:hypothetical protein
LLVGNPTPQSANCFSRNNTGADSDCRYGYNRCLDWQEQLRLPLLPLRQPALPSSSYPYHRCNRLAECSIFLLALLIHECLYYSNGPDVINGLQIKNL